MKLRRNEMKLRRCGSLKMVDFFLLKRMSVNIVFVVKLE